MAEHCPFEITPFAQSVASSPTPVFNLNYTCQEFWSLKNRLLQFMNEKFGKDFNDFTESSLAMMLVESWAFIADLLSFKIDQLANEMFIDTVTEIDNAFRLASLVGFKPTPPLPAKAMFIASIMNPYSEDLHMPSPILLAIPDTTKNRSYELFSADLHGNPIFDEDIIIPAGKLFTNAIVGLEGRTVINNTVSTGLPWQVVELLDSGILYNSMRVMIDGVEWQEVAHFNEYETGMEYRVEYTSHYKANLIFGNNKLGLIPSAGTQIDITYRTGGGEEGNVISGAFDEKLYIHPPGFENTIIINVKNYTKGEFGYSGDGIEDIRKKLPQYLMTQDRAVTGLDYKSLVDHFKSAYNGMVGKSTVGLRNHGCAGNIIDIYVLARTADNLTLANDNLKAELIEEIDKKKMFTDFTCVKDGTIVLVDIHLDIFLDRTQRRFEEQIKEKVERRLDDFFSIHNWEFGQTLRETDIIKVLADVKEVKHFEINFTTARGLETGTDESEVVSVKFNEIVRPDNVHIAFSYKEKNEI